MAIMVDPWNEEQVAAQKERFRLDWERDAPRREMELQKARREAELLRTLSRDRILWHEAPIPRRWHRCWTQTLGFVSDFGAVRRCACGGINIGDGWDERNSRRKEKAA